MPVMNVTQDKEMEIAVPKLVGGGDAPLLQMPDKAELPDKKDLTACLACCCCMCSLFLKWPDCCGCSQKGRVLCCETECTSRFLKVDDTTQTCMRYTAGNMCCDNVGDACVPLKCIVSCAGLFCCTQSMDVEFTFQDMTCLAGGQQLLCLDQRCALPTTEEIPCAVGACGTFCIGGEGVGDNA